MSIISPCDSPSIENDPHTMYGPLPYLYAISMIIHKYAARRSSARRGFSVHNGTRRYLSRRSFPLPGPAQLSGSSPRSRVIRLPGRFPFPLPSVRPVASYPGLLPPPRAHAPYVLIMRRWFFGGRRPYFIT